MDAQNNKNVSSNFDFCKIMKIHEKTLIKSANFFVIVYIVQRKDNRRHKDEIEDGREALLFNNLKISKGSERIDLTKPERGHT